MSKTETKVTMLDNGFYKTMVLDNGVSSGSLHSLTREDLIDIHQKIGAEIAKWS